MKKLLIVALALGLTSAVSAQNMASASTSNAKTEKSELTAEQRAEKMTKKQTEELNLTADQQKKAYQINLDKVVEMDRAKAQRDEMKARNEAVKDRSDKRMEEILTAEQMKIWEANQASKGEHRAEGKNAKSSSSAKSCCSAGEAGKSSCSGDKKAEEKK